MVLPPRLESTELSFTKIPVLRLFETFTPPSMNKSEFATTSIPPGGAELRINAAIGGNASAIAGDVDGRKLAVTTVFNSSGTRRTKRHDSCRRPKGTNGNDILASRPLLSDARALNGAPGKRKKRSWDRVLRGIYG